MLSSTYCIDFINNEVIADMNNEVIKVFVGCDPNNCDLEQMMVLDYSIKKHTQQPVEIIWMQLSRDPSSYWYSDPKSNQGWRTENWATPFSGFRLSLIHI